MPELQEFLRNEVQANLEVQKRGGRNLEFEDIKSFTLLDAYVKECLRYFTIIGFSLIPRMARIDARVGGVPLKKGYWVNIGYRFPTRT